MMHIHPHHRVYIIYIYIPHHDAYTSTSSCIYDISRGAKEALLVTNRPLASNELFEVELGQGSGFKGVKQEVKQIMKGKESIRIGVTIHW